MTQFLEPPHIYHKGSLRSGIVFKIKRDSVNICFHLHIIFPPFSLFGLRMFAIFQCIIALSSFYFGYLLSARKWAMKFSSAHHWNCRVNGEMLLYVGNVWIIRVTYLPREKYCTNERKSICSLNNWFTENTIQRYSCTVLNFSYRARIAR